MEIILQNLGKKFVKEWIFRGLDMEISNENPLAITGPNGSGKSTLLQIISGHHLPTEGSVRYLHHEDEIKAEDIFEHLTIASPYLELIEEFSLDEFLNFHFHFKPLSNGLSSKNFKEIVYLAGNEKKRIKHFSSGMKQRLKLGLAFFTDSKICLLDEPTSNLDEQGINWYLEHIEKVIHKKLIIVSSNQPKEYEFCTRSIHIPEYK